MIGGNLAFGMCHYNVIMILCFTVGRKPAICVDVDSRHNLISRYMLSYLVVFELNYNLNGLKLTSGEIC